MSRTFVIGIGGTGAKCVESFIHLCAAGAGPEVAWVGLIDQDQSNGNTARARRLIEQYEVIRNALRVDADASVSRDLGLFRTEVENGGLWCPVDDPSASLQRVFSYEMLKPELRNLMDILYSDREKNQEFSEGFRGHPSIGAPVMLSGAGHDHSFWRDFDRALLAARGGEDVRIVLFASIFGGTGAAGFPNIARMINTRLKDEGIDRGVSVAGVLMLPYFSFPSSADGQDLAARAERFLEESQGALHYYGQLLESSPFIDSLYVVGWSPLIELGYYSEGAESQVSPPLIPELYAGLAACNFCSEQPPDPGRLLVTARKEASKVSWDDLPAPKPGMSAATVLGGHARFCWAYKYIYAPSLLQVRRPIRIEQWFRRLLSRQGVNLRSQKTRSDIENLRSYSAQYLWWLANIATTAGDEESVELIDVSAVASRDRGDPLSPAALKEAASEREEHLYSDLVKGQNGRSLSEIFEALTYGDIPKACSGFGALPGALYHASALGR